MSNIVDIINVCIDIDKFKNGNDLSEDEFNNHGSKSGEFTISDGTEYTYSFNYGFTINKKSDFIKTD
jgi:hypothetical protein